MNELALLTGASGGIGKEMTQILAANGLDLLLIDKDQNALQEQKSTLNRAFPLIEVHILVMDLVNPSSATEVEEYTKHLNVVPTILINNAGFGTLGFFTHNDWDRERSMLQLHVMTLTHMTKIYATQMVAEGRGRIMNVASLAGFHPSPLMAVYNASKAYVISFSEALANEMKGTGVTVTVLCPGLTRTGFQKVVGGGEPDFTKSSWLSSTPKMVARKAYQDMMKGKVISIPGFFNRLLANGYRFVPRNTVVHLVRKIQEQNRRL